MNTSNTLNRRGLPVDDTAWLSDTHQEQPQTELLCFTVDNFSCRFPSAAEDLRLRVVALA